MLRSYTTTKQNVSVSTVHNFVIAGHYWCPNSDGRFIHCYRGACGPCVIAASAHSSDDQYDINEPLLLPPTIAIRSMTSDDCCYCGEIPHVWLLIAHIAAMGRMTSADHCYCGAHSIRAEATSAHSSNGSSDISRPLVLPSTITTGRMISVGYCYSHPQ
jgi:hypothetical protein